MRNKLFLSVLFLNLGVISLLCGSKISGAFIGFGVGFICVGIWGFCNCKNLKIKKDDEVNNEQFMYKRYKACYKAYEISKWFILILAAIVSYMQFPVWLTMYLCCLYSYNAFLQVYFINKTN